MSRLNIKKAFCFSLIIFNFYFFVEARKPKSPTYFYREKNPFFSSEKRNEQVQQLEAWRNLYFRAKDYVVEAGKYCSGNKVLKHRKLKKYGTPSRYVEVCLKNLKLERQLLVNVIYERGEEFSSKQRHSLRYFLKEYDEVVQYAEYLRDYVLPERLPSLKHGCYFIMPLHFVVYYHETYLGGLCMTSKYLKRALYRLTGEIELFKFVQTAEDLDYALLEKYFYLKEIRFLDEYLKTAEELKEKIESALFEKNRQEEEEEIIASQMMWGF